METPKYSPEMAQTLADALNWLTLKGWSPSMRWEHWNADQPVITVHARSLDADYNFLDAMCLSITESWQIEGFAQKWQKHLIDTAEADNVELFESKES